MMTNISNNNTLKDQVSDVSVNQHQQYLIIQDLLSRPIAFHSIFTKLGIGITGAVFLSQALYWSRNKTSLERGGWFYKTIDEWEEETSLSRKEQAGARAKLVNLKILEEERRDTHGKLFYRVNEQKLIELLINIKSNTFNPSNNAISHQENPHKNQVIAPLGQSSLSQRGNDDCPKGENISVPMGQTSLSDRDSDDCPDQTITYTEITNRDYIQNKQINKQACAEIFIDFKNVDSVGPEVSQVVHYLNQEIGMPIDKLSRADDLAAVKAMLDSGIDLSLIQKAALKAARTKPQGGFGIYYVKKIAEEIFAKEEAGRKCVAIKQVLDSSLKPTMKEPTVKKKIISDQEILKLKIQLKEKNIEFNNVCREITNAAGESKTSFLMRHSRLGMELSAIENSLKAISYD